MIAEAMKNPRRKATFFGCGNKGASAEQDNHPQIQPPTRFATEKTEQKAEVFKLQPEKLIEIEALPVMVGEVSALFKQTRDRANPDKPPRKTTRRAEVRAETEMLIPAPSTCPCVRDSEDPAICWWHALSQGLQRVMCMRHKRLRTRTFDRIWAYAPASPHKTEHPPLNYASSDDAPEWVARHATQACSFASSVNGCLQSGHVSRSMSVILPHDGHVTILGRQLSHVGKHI